MVRTPPFLFALLLTGAIAVRNGIADDDDEFAARRMQAANNIEWAQMTVKIVDSEGQPIVGAKVRPWALRAGNGHGWWDKNTYGAPQQTSTDDKGETDVVFPHSVKHLETHQVVQVSLFVSHADFCTQNSHVDVPGGNPPNIPQVTLNRGVRLRIACVAPGSDQPLSDCHVMLENAETAEPEFIPDAEGWMQSIPIREDRRWFRVIRTPPGEPPQFSKLQAWNPEDPASRELRVEVRPGVRVLGRISDDVARPIERGQVVAWCGSPVHQEQANKPGRVSPIWWIDTVPIQKDGTFEFDSLPTGHLAQFYAFANDSISARPTDEAYETCCKWFSEQNRQRNNFFRCGQILRLAGSKSEITIEMEPAGLVMVKCVDPEGHPLRKISVSSWPNQYMVGGGSTVFCTRQSSLDRLRGRFEFDWSTGSPYTAVTDDKGEVVIRNLPKGEQSLVAGNAIWTSRREDKVNSNPDKTTEITIKLQRVSQEKDEGLIEKAQRFLDKIRLR